MTRGRPPGQIYPDNFHFLTTTALKDAAQDAARLVAKRLGLPQDRFFSEWCREAIRQHYKRTTGKTPPA